MPNSLLEVGLASGILQLTDFTVKILLKDHEVYQPKDGSSVDNRLLVRNVSDELNRLVENLDAHTLKKPDADKKSGKLGEAVQQLLRLSDDTRALVAPLIDAFAQAQAKCTPDDAPWPTLRDGLLTVWNRGQITNLKKRLRASRKDVDTTFLRALRAHLDQASEKVLSMISVDDPQTVHREKWLKDALEAIRANDWKSKNKKNVEAFSALTDKLVVAEDEAHFRDQVFKYLHFPEQDDRLHSISKPDENSFDWIFDERRQKEGSFIEWLGGTSGQNVFWMTGKAGSGKSTLMKYLFRNEDLFPHLEQWSGQSPGILTGFFLWNCGKELQKTTIGLLRTLIYEALQDMIYGPLEQDSSIVQWVFDNRWNQFVSHRGGMQPFNLVELECAFELLISDFTKKFLFMIDGLDELNEGPTNALNILLNASRRENVKICISSRSSLVFQAAFKDLPSLELHQWTREGVLGYVLYAFDQNDTMFNIPAEESDGTEERAIVNTLVEKAAGAFLWASLATEFLIQSTNETDDVSTIKWRVNALPSDLDDLLTYIFDNLDKSHFEQASRLFRLVDANGYPSLLSLCRAAEVDTRSSLDAETRPLTASEVLSQAERLRNVLVFKCKNMLSIFEAVPNDEKRNSIEVADLAHYKVNYAHRSIRDFVRSTYMNDRILKATDYEVFSEDEHWANAHLWRLKTLQVQEGRMYIWDALADCIEHALRLETTDKRVRLTYLDEVNATLATHLTNPATPISVMDLPPGAIIQSFGDIAVWLNLTNYLFIKARSADKKDLRHAMDYAKDVRKRLGQGGEARFIGNRSRLQELYGKVDSDLVALLEYHTKSMKLGSPKVFKDMPEWV